MKNAILPPEWFERSAVPVARELLGKYLVRRIRGRETAAMIIETEAYEGLRDKASHASRGETPRNKVMFGPPGYWYVYFTYGMHWLLNITTGKEGHPGAVLIRGVESIMGPARLTKALSIGKAMNTKQVALCSGLWIEDRGVRPRRIAKGARIGVGYADSEWAGKEYRFYVLQSQKK